MSIFLKSMSCPRGFSESKRDGRKEDEYAVYDAVYVEKAQTLRCIDC